MEQVNLGAGMAANGPTWPAGKTQIETAHLPGSTNLQGGVAGGGHGQPDPLRVAFLEAGLKSTQSHNVNLQHHVAFLQAQMIGHLGHITKLQTRVRALESELASLKAKPVAADPVAAGATPPLSPASASAEDLHPPLPGPQREPKPPNPAASGAVGNYALWDLRPTDGDGSGGSGLALTTSGQRESGAVPPETTTQAARSPSPTPTPGPAATSFSGASEDVQVDPSADSTSTRAAVAETCSAIVAEQAANLSSCDSATQTIVKASATPRHPLHDFWADNSRDNSDTSAPAINTRSRGLRGDSARKRSESSMPNGRITIDEANADEVKPSEPVHHSVGHRTRGAEERGTLSIEKPTLQTELVAPSESACGTGRAPVLWCATEGREGAEDRSSHLMDCALCQDPLPEDESIGRCGVCPRSFCTQCLEHGLHEEGVNLKGLDQDGRAMLDGRTGDFFVEQCPHCIRGCDDHFTAPSPGAVPMEHLLNELMQHDLSICFREPVDTDKHPDYVESIGRLAMMDLGTMLDKLERKRYPRRRGPGQFLEDLNRIWRNCRRYAGCDELGQPHYGTTVPGIVRCALILEAMSIKFCAAYMSDKQGAEAWQESTWDFHRERQERVNAEARLKQLKSQGKSLESKKAKPLESPGVGGQHVNVAAKKECREGATSNGSAEANSPADPCSVQHPTPDSSGGGGRKRGAAEMEGEPRSERADAGAHAQTRAVMARTDETPGGTPKTRRPSAGKAKLQQPPWSPLDRLCDLASTFNK